MDANNQEPGKEDKMPDAGDDSHAQPEAKPNTQTRSLRSTPARRNLPRQRAPYTEAEKAKIQEVRRQRACLRCKMLKIQCSKENPCVPCLSSATKGMERKVLSFCYCVRTRYIDVNIFDGQSGELDGPASRVRSLLSGIGTSPSSSGPDETRFENLIVRWLTEPTFEFPCGSVIGSLCSTTALAQLGEAVDDEIVADFRTFLFATSAARTGWRHPRASSRDLLRVAHAAGSSIIRRLDKIFTPQHLGRCNSDTIRALFLLALGLILGVGYTAHQAHSPCFPHDALRPELQESPTLWMTMREHLCQMLAHHLIFLGSLMGIRLETGIEQYIIDKAIRGWDKVEAHIWGETMTHLSISAEGAPAAAEGGSSDSTDRNRQLLAVACPEIPILPHPDSLGENPTSYLSMAEDDFKLASGSSATTGYMPSTAYSYSNPPPFGPVFPDVHVPLRKVKRRSVWVVRPFDAGPQGLVNVHARFRVHEGQSIGLFV